jgi:hypothetical protein
VAAASLATLLSHYPFLSALTVIFAATPASDAVLLAVAAAPAGSRFSALQLLPDSAVSFATLLATCPPRPGLTSLHLTTVEKKLQRRERGLRRKSGPNAGTRVRVGEKNTETIPQLRFVWLFHLSVLP